MTTTPNLLSQTPALTDEGTLASPTFRTSSLATDTEIYLLLIHQINTQVKAEISATSRLQVKHQISDKIMVKTPINFINK